MASHFYGEGVQSVSLSPSDSGHDPGNMEPCAEPLPMEIDEMSPGNSPCGGRFPADTPITPPQFCDKIKDKPLPGDGSGRECFDTFPTFVVGDPSARFGTHTPLTYETNGEVGQPIWKDIFRHILKECSYLTAFNTVYVMVDTRNLMAHGTAQDGLPHWPAAVAWWHSRVQLMGPHQEKTELLFFPASEETGLHRVHPTWAGTFVLAALVSIFPGINFILLDSDCLPITLSEAADLWKEAYLTRFPSGTGKGLPQRHPLHRKREFANHPDVVYTQHRVNADRQGQGVLLVTEPHSELNAGLVVIFSSSHPPLFNWADWTRRCRRLPDTQFDSLLATATEKVEQSFLALLTGFLHRTLSMQDLTPGEMQCWIQSGLVLSPLVATCTQYSVDFCLAWALIGEWTSRILFPVPKLGHAMGMLEPCWKNTKPEAQELLRGLELHLSKVHCLPYFSCRVLFLSLPCLEIECFRPQDWVTTDSDHHACLWRSQNWDGTSITVNRERGMDPVSCCDGRHRWQKTFVGRPWTATGGGYHRGH